jgi:hypothetical protein
MKDIVRALTGGTTYCEISNVALDHPETRISVKRGKDFVEICAMASRVVVDTDNCLPESEKFLKEIRADEPGDSGDDPDFGGSDEQFAKPTVRWGNHELTVEEYPPRPDSGQHAREHASSITRAALRDTLTRRDKASSIPTEPHVVRHISRVSTGVYDFGRQFTARDHSLLCRGVAPFLWWSNHNRFVCFDLKRFLAGQFNRAGVMRETQSCLNRAERGVG